MNNYREYKKHEPLIVGKKKKIDNNIYTFDIETTSYLILNGKIYDSNSYEKFDDKEKEQCEKHSCMYIWMFGINDDVYYGRTWDELKEFLKMIDDSVPDKKILYIHNLAFEFQYLKSQFTFEDVFARVSRKVIKCKMSDYNFELRCSYMLSNVALENLAEVYKMDVKKLVGNLDYNIIRSPFTILSDKEIAYCENDILVLYNYIKLELKTYLRIDKIPITSTGKVRRELMELIFKDYTYKRQTRNSINYNPHIYSLLNMAYAGGYTHANYLFTDEIIEDVDSFDFTSSYPYVLLCYKYPSSRFKKCKIKSIAEMHENFAYLLKVKFTKIECLYFNHFISYSKCLNIINGRYDNGRVIKADELEIVLTDVDFKFILKTYKCNYEILESYFANYNFLPKLFIDFVLDKYNKKTELKDVDGKEIEYQLEKSKFNSLYGMAVTSTIKDKVNYDNQKGWSEIPLSNDEIEVALYKEFKKGFFNFATGVWCTAWARVNLLENVRLLDTYAIYMDTDSIKLLKGYDKKIIDNYNKNVIERIKNVAKILNVPYSKFAPSDIKGNKHIIGIFESETKGDRKYTFDRFITQGSKKYATETDGKIKITVAGVPKKKGSNAIKKLEDFKDDFVFKSSETGKQTLYYIDEQQETKIVDCQGNIYINKDKTGCCFVPCTYILGKSEEYANLLTDNASNRAYYNGG